jgi:nitrogen fixation protein NifT
MQNLIRKGVVMAKVMLRESDGVIYFYVAKKDMEETIESIEFDSDEKWGGEVELANGETWWIKPDKKALPKEVNCKKVSD